MIKEWKLNQQTYSVLMSARHTDLMYPEHVVEEETVNVESVRNYVDKCTYPLFQPSKSRIVSIVYAYLLEKYFDENFFEVLNDSNLFLGEDLYFKTYDEDREGYDLVIETLGSFESWKFKGWILRSYQYFWLECTNDGLNFASTASDEEIELFLNQDFDELKKFR